MLDSEREVKYWPVVWKPRSRSRNVSPALQAYAAFTTSAARGAVRDIAQRQ